MIDPQDPRVVPEFKRLLDLITAHGVRQWTEGKIDQPSLEGLVYLCKFGFFTGLLTKAEIGRILGLDHQERKLLVRSWYDDHRQKGCGTC